MPKIKIGNTSFNYQLRGRGRWIVLLHGIGGDLHSFDPIVPGLAKRNRILSFDQRGFGKSDKPSDVPYGTELWTDDLANLLLALKIKEKVVVIGHSLGGRIACHFAFKYPDRVEGLITLDTTAWGSNPIGGEQMRKIASRLPKEGMSAALDSTPWIKSLRPSYVRIRKILEKVTLANDPVAYALAAESVAADFLGETDSSFLQKIDCPTLIIVGDRDSAPLEGALQMHRSIKESRLGVIPDCGHFSAYEKPSIVLSMLFDFLSNS